jgi:hypothetical protein
MIEYELFEFLWLL